MSDLVRTSVTVLARWPLLLLGLVVVGWTVYELRDRDDPSDARALLLGLGSMILGAGLVLVAQGHAPRDARHADDTPTDTPNGRPS